MARMLLPGWVERKRGAFSLLARADLAEALEALGALETSRPEQWRGEVLARFVGRGAPIAMQVRDQVLVIKELRHGGLLAPVTQDWFLSSDRLRSTLELTAHLARQGTAVAEIAFLREERVLGPLRRLVMGTVLVAGSEDLLVRLRAGRARPLMRDLGALVAGMHEAGVFHADLNLKNILVAERLSLIDLEASACHDGVPRRLRVSNLERLLRSAAKNDLLGRTVTLTDVVRFLQGYDAARWKEWFASVAEAFRRGMGRHRLFWRLERARNS